MLNNTKTQSHIAHFTVTVTACCTLPAWDHSEAGQTSLLYEAWWTDPHDWKHAQPVLTCRVCRAENTQITTANKQTACPWLDATDWSANLSAVKQLHVREIRAYNARQWHSCFLCWLQRLAVWGKEWGSRLLSRRWAWPCIMWITSTVCYRSWNVVKLKCNNLSLVNSNSQDFFLKTKTETKTLLQDQDSGSQDQDQDFIFCPRGASRPRLWSRGLHNCWSQCRTMTLSHLCSKML